jgi:integrase/recombinase XerD
MLIQKAYDLFLADRKISGCSPKTLYFYRDSAGKFTKYIVDNEGNIEVNRINEFITPYFLFLQDRKISQTTRHTYYRGISTFVRFLHSERYIDQEIRLPKIKCPKTAIKPLSPEQMRKALQSFNTKRFTGLRNKTILFLFLDTGMRLSELLNIELHEINFDDGFILLHGKGQKERWVPFGKEARRLLWDYLKQRERVTKAEESALFITQKGEKLTVRGLQMVFKRLGKKLNLSGIRFSPHTFRHSFSLAYIEAGGDPFSLQRILGHSTQAMTAKYVHMAKNNVKAQHNKFSPGDRL